MATGRFAPSPTGDLHLGNLRTALVAWLAARADGGAFLLRMEDLDREQSSPVNAARQRADLTRLGLDWDGDPIFQSNRFDRYDEVIAQLHRDELLYPCYCTRREIAEAASAPHKPDGVYPGICRNLSTQQRRRRERDGRPPALRLRGSDHELAFDDAVYGPGRGPVDDVVVRRNDGIVAYNLAVVVDDADSGVTQVIRGDDLLASVPRQLHIAACCELAAPSYAHVPLVMAPNGDRLAKRHGAVTLSQREAAGDTVEELVGVMAHSLGLTPDDAPTRAADLVSSFTLADVSPRRWTAPAPWCEPPTGTAVAAAQQSG